MFMCLRAHVCVYGCGCVHAWVRVCLQGRLCNIYPWVGTRWAGASTRFPCPGVCSPRCASSVLLRLFTSPPCPANFCQRLAPPLGQPIRDLPATSVPCRPFSHTRQAPQPPFRCILYVIFIGTAHIRRRWWMGFQHGNHFAFFFGKVPEARPTASFECRLWFGMRHMQRKQHQSWQLGAASASF